MRLQPNLQSGHRAAGVAAGAEKEPMALLKGRIAVVDDYRLLLMLVVGQLFDLLLQFGFRLMRSGAVGAAAAVGLLQLDTGQPLVAVVGVGPVVGLDADCFVYVAAERIGAADGVGFVGYVIAYFVKSNCFHCY